jgi:Zn-dependent peptidase ImmA (M78 family)
VDWATVHRVVSIRATQALGDLGVDQSQYVDVMALLARSDLDVIAQPMRRLFGAYLPDPYLSGVLLNSALDETTLRHAAAHEFGHHVMEHAQCFTEDLESLSINSRGAATPERQAEAFGAWLLMPIRAVRRALRHLGHDVPAGPGDAYQLSLHLGTSYRGTVRHLRNLKMINVAQERAWAAIPPVRLRTQVCNDRHDVPARVWDLRAASAGARLAVRPGDRLLVRGAWVSATPRYRVPDGVVAVAGADGLQLDVDSLDTDEARVEVVSALDGSTWSVTMFTPVPGGRGRLLDPTDNDVRKGNSWRS